MSPPIHTIPYLQLFDTDIQQYELPDTFTLLLNNNPHPLCLLAAQELQLYINNQQEWEHNFGLSADTKGAIIGKMFGVLVVRTTDNQIGYLCAFSGKLAGANLHSKFVPPIFDALTENSFLTIGMRKLALMGTEIKKLEALQSTQNETIIRELKTRRKKYSIALQAQLFDHYFFLNQAMDTKSIYDIFTAALYKNPPSGAGECATPKLLQHAFKFGLKPIALAEFWWGQSPKSVYWKHGHFYPCCKEKCEPILMHMLKGLDMVYT